MGKLYPKIVKDKTGAQWYKLNHFSFDKIPPWHPDYVNIFNDKPNPNKMDENPIEIKTNGSKNTRNNLHARNHSNSV